MIRSTTRIDRRRKPAPTWEPPTRGPSISQRLAASIKAAEALRKEPRRA